MKMSIAECIKRIGDMRRNYDRWSGLGLTPNESEAFKTAIDTMRKYQKIQEIVEHWACCGNPSNSIIAISEVVLEDGKNN